MLIESGMGKIIAGMAVLVSVSFLLGIATHWLVGAAALVLPIALTYIRIKLSPTFKAKAVAKLNDAFGS